MSTANMNWLSILYSTREVASITRYETEEELPQAIPPALVRCFPSFPFSVR